MEEEREGSRSTRVRDSCVQYHRNCIFYAWRLERIKPFRGGGGSWMDVQITIAINSRLLSDVVNGEIRVSTSVVQSFRLIIIDEFFFFFYLFDRWNRIRNESRKELETSFICTLKRNFIRLGVYKRRSNEKGKFCNFYIDKNRNNDRNLWFLRGRCKNVGERCSLKCNFTRVFSSTNQIIRFALLSYRGGGGGLILERGVAKFETVAINRRPTGPSVAPLKCEFRNDSRVESREPYLQCGWKKRKFLLFLAGGAERISTSLHALSSHRVACSIDDWKSRERVRFAFAQRLEKYQSDARIFDRLLTRE